MVNRYAIGRQFEGSEPLERFLSRFEFEVLGEKLVGTGRYAPRFDASMEIVYGNFQFGSR